MGSSSSFREGLCGKGRGRRGAAASRVTGTDLRAAAPPGGGGTAHGRCRVAPAVTDVPSGGRRNRGGGHNRNPEVCLKARQSKTVSMDVFTVGGAACHDDARS